LLIVPSSYIQVLDSLVAQLSFFVNVFDKLLAIVSSKFVIVTAKARASPPFWMLPKYLPIRIYAAHPSLKGESRF